MKNIFKIIVTVWVIIFSQHTFATQAPWDLQTISVSDTSINITWQEVPDVLWYYIYYWKSTGSWSDYDIEWVDLIEENNYILTDLQAETQYYIALTAVDETGSESDKSPELEAFTLSAWSESQELSLRIISTKVIDDTSIEMEFSLDMESWSNALRQFIIENIDSGQQIWVDISDVVPGKPKNILAILDGKLLPNSQYKVTVLDIRDINGNTIESWIDSFANFMTPKIFATELESAWASQQETLETDTNMENAEEENNQWEKEKNNIEMVDENIIIEDSEPLGNNAGTNISSNDLSYNTLNTAAKNNKLPQTGPEQWILLFVWVMLWTGLFYRLKK